MLRQGTARRRGQSSIQTWPLVIIGVSIVALIVLWRTWPTAPPPELRSVTPRGELAEIEKATIALFKENLPSVVHINTLVIKKAPYQLNVLKVPKGTGSGFVWDQQGHIITNNHVLQGANAAVVVMANQTSWNATLVGADPSNDIAVLKISASAASLRPMPIGESGNLQVGQSVFAIGNPYGLNGSLTAGVVSGLGRELETEDGARLKGLIQTDAAINPGNSGGPLLDSAGRIIGVNTAILSPSGAYAGIGLAIPIDRAKLVIEGIINKRPVLWSKLGIQEAPDQWAKAQGIKGVWVLEVTPNSPAHLAGLQATVQEKDGACLMGDVIVAVNGSPVTSVKELYLVIVEVPVQAKISLTVMRDGKKTEKQLDVK